MDIEEVLKIYKEDIMEIDGSKIKKLTKNLAMGDKSSFQKLNSINSMIEDIIVKSSLKVIDSDAFKNLSNKGKADVVRNILSIGPTSGYSKNASASEIVMQGFLKSKNIFFIPKHKELDNDRLEDCVRSIITQLITEEDGGRSKSIIERSFSNIATSGSRNVIEETDNFLKSKGINLLKRRVVKGSSSCDFCKKFEGKYFVKNEEFYGFHDNCSCYIILDIL